MAGAFGPDAVRADAAPQVLAGGRLVRPPSA